MMRKAIVTNLVVLSVSSAGCDFFTDFDKELTTAAGSGNASNANSGGKANGDNASLAGNATIRTTQGGATTNASTNTSSATSGGASTSDGISSNSGGTPNSGGMSDGGATATTSTTGTGGVVGVSTTTAIGGGTTGVTTSAVGSSGGRTSGGGTGGAAAGRTNSSGGTTGATTTIAVGSSGGRTSGVTVATGGAATGGAATGGVATGGAASGGVATGGGTTTTKKANGAPATLGSECLSTIVADGVCCDKACTGCNACSGSPLTAGAVGQCSYVVAGQVAHNACTASGTTCGLDGKCDGAGDCRYSPAEAASCDDPSNLCTTGRVCQNHVCTPGTTKTCNAPPACKLSTTCSGGACNYTQNAPDETTDTKCPATTPYCFTGSCYQCKDDGQCGVPTPSCHPTSHTCVCRIPSSTNLLTNPGFDGSFSGWGGAAEGMALAADSDGCTASNSVYAASAENACSQCVPIDAQSGSRYFGGRFIVGNSDSKFRFYFYDQPNCTGNISPYLDIPLTITSSWQTQGGLINIPSGTKSLSMQGLLMLTYVDQLYLNTSNHF